MKVTNFVPVENSRYFATGRLEFAEVDVMTGILWWKRSTKKKVSCTPLGTWFFIETGETCPGFMVENLARAWIANRRYSRQVN